MAQRSSTTAFAKSTRPEIGGAVQREALYTRVDGTPARTVVWVSGPPGFGKTTLAASYLEARNYRWAWYEVDPDDDDGETFFHYLAHAVRRFRSPEHPLPAFEPEHRANIAAFARRYFRALFADVAAPCALVLDNVHELPSESALRTILEAGLPQVPRQCCVIVTSRAPPPFSLSRLQPSGQMVCVTADELKISTDELAEMARLRGKPLSPSSLVQLQQHADGWAAALVLMVEHHKLAEVPAQLPGEVTPKVVFDYFAGEIFERFEPATQRLLLQIACLPRVTIEIARALSGDDSAARVLFNLAHNDYFVREHVGPEGRVFVFHPLLREFLLRRAAREMPQALGADALQRAARLLRESGQPEDALALFVERREWGEVAAIVREQAETWLDSRPQFGPRRLARAVAGKRARCRRRRCSSRWPRPSRTSARAPPADVSRLRSKPSSELGDGAGMARACVGVLDTVLREFDDLTVLDRWLAAFERGRAGSYLPKTTTPSPVLMARMWREPGHPWRRTKRAAQARRGRSGKPGQTESWRVRWQHLLGGDFAASATIARGIAGSDGASRLALATCNSLRALLDGDNAHGACRCAFRSRGRRRRGRPRPGRLAAPALLRRHASDKVRDRYAARGRARHRRGDAAPARRPRFRALPARRLGRRRGQTPAWHCGKPVVQLQLAVEAGLPWFECLARVAVSQWLARCGR